MNIILTNYPPRKKRVVRCASWHVQDVMQKALDLYKMDNLDSCCADKTLYLIEVDDKLEQPEWEKPENARLKFKPIEE